MIILLPEGFGQLADVRDCGSWPHFELLRRYTFENCIYLFFVFVFNFIYLSFKRRRVWEELVLVWFVWGQAFILVTVTIQRYTQLSKLPHNFGLSGYLNIYKKNKNLCVCVSTEAKSKKIDKVQYCSIILNFICWKLLNVEALTCLSVTAAVITHHSLVQICCPYLMIKPLV